MDNETLASAVGDGTGLLYSLAADALLAPPIGDVVGQLANHAATGVAFNALNGIEDILHGDVRALPELIGIVTDPMGVANQHLIEDLPIVGPVVGEVLSIWR